MAHLSFISRVFPLSALLSLMFTNSLLIFVIETNPEPSAVVYHPKFVKSFMHQGKTDNNEDNLFSQL